MSLYIVEAEKLSNKFGVLRKGEKFNADKDDPELKALVSNGDVKNVRPTPVKTEKTEVDEAPVNIELADEAEEKLPEIEVKPKGKRRK